MSDGDIIRGLQRPYQKPYKALSEGKATNNECAQFAIKALQQDIKNKGDVPVILAKRMGKSLKQAFSDARGMIFMDWAAQRREFNKIVEQVDCPHRLKELTLRAGMRYIDDLKYGKEVDINCSSETILSQYMIEVYEAGFKECIPPETDAAIIERLEQIEPIILSVIHKWAKKADTEGSVKNLQLRSILKVKEVNNLEDDLLAVHNHNNSRKIDELLQTPSNVTSQSWKHYLSIDNGEPI